MNVLKLLVTTLFSLMISSQALVYAADKTVSVNSTDNLNFNYTVQTEKSKYSPQHIFDDGNKTYVLLSEKAEGKYIRIFAKRNDGNYDLIMPEQDDKFLILPGIYTNLQLRIDEVLVTVSRN